MTSIEEKDIVRVVSEDVERELTEIELWNIWYCFDKHTEKYGKPDERTCFIQEVTVEHFAGTVIFRFRNLDTESGYNLYGFKSQNTVDTTVGILYTADKQIMLSLREIEDIKLST